MQFAPPARHLLNAKDLADARYFEPIQVANILDRKNFAVVATLNPDGGPQNSVVWYEREGHTIPFSVTRDKTKARNLVKDPRIALAILDTENPYDSVDEPFRRVRRRNRSCPPDAASTIAAW